MTPSTLASPAVLTTDSLRSYVAAFNRRDETESGLPTDISNHASFEFLSHNVPLFDCPDKQLEETYYYRWWSYRKHLKKTPAGWVVTEFLPAVPWAGTYNTISCAAGHHLYEGRWLREGGYLEDYARFWALPEAAPRNYSFWYADSVKALAMATGNRRLAWDLLPNLVANYRAWERTHFDSSRLFNQIDDRDGMEFSLGGSGLRPSINAYMYGDASAIANLAHAFHDQALSEEFSGKAQRLKDGIQRLLWNEKDQFFETTKSEHAGLKSSEVREQMGFIP